MELAVSEAKTNKIFKETHYKTIALIEKIGRGYKKATYRRGNKRLLSI